MITVGRADYGILLPIIRSIQADASLNLRLFGGGMHLSPHFGLTVQQIESDGFKIDERVVMGLSSDTPDSIAISMGLGVIGFSHAYSNLRPDLLIVIGDRFEAHSAAIAALPFKIPIAHVHGGEVTEGAIDDAIRHSITKLSHLHFVSTEIYKNRIIQMGEEPWRVVVSGAPSLDNFHTITSTNSDAIRDELGLDVDKAFLLVTYHPVTMEYENTEFQIKELLRALEDVNLPVVFSKANSDTYGSVINRELQNHVDTHEETWLVDNLGLATYANLMNHALAMVGNSSSGIIEAPYFGLPVVNIGNRQKGRIRAENVIDVGYDRSQIVTGINKATAVTFKETIKQAKNPYGDGKAAEIILVNIKRYLQSENLIHKRFNDLNVTSSDSLSVGS